MTERLELDPDRSTETNGVLHGSDAVAEERPAQAGDCLALRLQVLAGLNALLGELNARRDKSPESRRELQCS